MKDLEEELEGARERLKIVDIYRHNVVMSLESFLASNVSHNSYDNTYESHIFNHVVFALYENIIINLRKICEPDTHSKANLMGLTKTINKYKDSIIEKKINESNLKLKQRGNSEHNYNNGIIEVYLTQKGKLKDFLFIGELNKLQINWTEFFKSEDAEILKKARHLIAHSNNEKNIKLPSANKVEKILREVTEIIDKINLILNNSNADYEYERDDIGKIAISFWEKASIGMVKATKSD